MKSMKKVELIIESVYLNRMVELLKNNGVNGYTVIKDIEGYGHHGLQTADDVSDVYSNIYIFTICEVGTYEAMDQDIRKFLHKYGGKCFISDAMLVLDAKKK